jgi:hypothetical protein
VNLVKSYHKSEIIGFEGWASQTPKPLNDMMEERDMPGLLDLTIAKATVEAFAWLMSLGASEIKHVKDETQELLNHLAKSLRSLWDITNEVARLSDEDFRSRFQGVYKYFKDFYYDPEHIEKARTHCSDLDRDIGRIKFKLSVFLRTDIGKWRQAKEGLRHTVLEDHAYINAYKQNFKLLNSKLNEINNLLRENKEKEALAAYQALRIDLSEDLDHLNDYIERMREADTYIRQIAG